MYRIFLRAACLFLLVAAAATAANDINVTGGTRPSAGETVTDASVINGDGSVDGTFAITAGDVVTNTTTVQVTSDSGTRGILAIDGGSSQYLNDAGAETVFATDGGSAGGMLRIDNGGEYVNNGTTRFLEGANFAISTGTVLNNSTMYVHTGMEGGSALDLLLATSQATNGKLIIEGNSSLFNSGTFNHVLSDDTAAIGTEFVFRTIGDLTQNINLHGATMKIEAESAGVSTSITLRGAVTANTIAVAGRTANFTNTVTTGYHDSFTTIDHTGLFSVASDATVNFTGTNAVFAAGDMENAGRLNFLGGGSYTSADTLTNTGQLTFGNTAFMQGGGDLINSGTVFFQAGSVLTNDGTITNSGSFQNDGTYTGDGILANTGQFINNGKFENNSLVGITNSGGGVMRFNEDTDYVGGSVLIWNTGTVKASAEMFDSDLRALMADLDMATAGGESGVFDLVAAASVTLDGSFVFGNSAAGAAANIDAGSHAITFGANAGFDAGNAGLNLIGGSVVVKDDVAFKTTADFTVKSEAHFDFTGGDGYSAEIHAANVVASGKGKISVGKNNTLDVTGNLKVEDQGLVVAGAGGRITVSGTADIAGGGRIELGDKAELRVTGNIAFAGDSAISITATKTDISRIVSVSGGIAVASPTEVTFNGTKNQILDKVFMESLTGGVDYENLHNALYIFEVKKNATGGDQVYVSGIRSVIDAMAGAFGGHDRLSINKYNGGSYTDDILQTKWGAGNTSLATYLQLAASPTLGAQRSYAAYGQLYGEYAAYASTPLLSASAGFRESVSRQLYRSPYVLTDPAAAPEACASDGETALAISGRMSAATSNRIWGGGFGDWQRQDNGRRLHGYDYSSSGLILGYDYNLEGVVIGVAGAYGYGTLKVNDLGAKFRSDTFSLGTYASYVHDSGVQLNATLGYTVGWNDYDVRMELGGAKHGKYDNYAFTGALEVTYQAELPDEYYLAPSLGIAYTYMRQDDWVETLHPETNPLVANAFSHRRQGTLDIPLSLAFGKEFLREGFTVRPEARTSWVYHASGRQNRILSGYYGAGQQTTMHGVWKSSATGLLGLGVTARFGSGIGVSLNYDYEFSGGGFRNHNLTGMATLAF